VLLSDVSVEADLMAQEIFGPGAPVVPFYTEDEAVGMANDTPWRLAGHLLTQEVDDAFGGVGLRGRHVARNTGALSNPPRRVTASRSPIWAASASPGHRQVLEFKCMAVPQV
jgi:succinate-semialdehyde dehydrogenase / glutarate-semialdehyde dehydrogenase